MDRPCDIHHTHTDRTRDNRRLLWALVTLMIIFWPPSRSTAFTLTLAWDKNPESNIQGYYLDYGLSSCSGSATCSYPNRVTVAPGSTCSADPRAICHTFQEGVLQDGKVYYFAVKAYNAYGVSGYSNELTYPPPASPTNRAPVAQNRSLSVTEDTPWTGSLPASDPDGNKITFAVVTPPARGTLTSFNTATGAFTYTPHPNVNGNDAFTFRVSDGHLPSNTATVSISIAAVNDPPAAKVDEAHTTRDQPVTISVLANDTDVDGDVLSLTAVTQGKSGSTSRVGNAVRYTPNTGFTGTDTFEYTVSDGKGATAKAKVTVTVHPSSGDASAQSVVLAVNAGGPAATAADGTFYQADAWYSGGSTYSVATAIEGADSQAVYQTERFGDFSYSLPVANGDYLLTLKFAEIYWSEKGKRVFDVWVEGKAMLQDFDLAAASGSHRAWDIHVPVTVRDGRLDVVFTSSVDYAKLSALLLRKASPAFVHALNFGGAAFRGSNAVEYSADPGVWGGAIHTTASDIAGTEDDTLYRSERFGSFACRIPLPAGTYLVTLKFAEIYWSEKGKRVFDVFLEGEEVIRDLDIFAKAGKNVAYDSTHLVTVADGVLDMSFRSDVDHAKVSAILIQKAY